MFWKQCRFVPIRRKFQFTNGDQLNPSPNNFVVKKHSIQCTYFPHLFNEIMMKLIGIHSFALCWATSFRSANLPPNNETHFCFGQGPVYNHTRRTVLNWPIKVVRCNLSVVQYNWKSCSPDARNVFRIYYYRLFIQHKIWFWHTIQSCEILLTETVHRDNLLFKNSTSLWKIGLKRTSEMLKFTILKKQILFYSRYFLRSWYVCTN